MAQTKITDDQLDGIAGSKVSGAVALATTVTTNANLTGDVTSVGNATTLGTVPVAKGGTGATIANTAFNNLAPSQGGNSGLFLTTNGTNTSWAATSSVAGSTTQIQYNNAGVLAANAGFTYISASAKVSIQDIVNNSILRCLIPRLCLRVPMPRRRCVPTY